MQIDQRVLDWAPRTAFAGSILLAASAAAHLTGTLMMPEPALPAEHGGGAAASVQKAAFDHAGRILVAKLMGEAPKAAAPARPAQVPETRLNLKLIGVLSTAGASGIAIIADSRGDEKMYSVGAKIPGGAVLREVMADRVLLEGASGLETLRLFDPTQGDAASYPAPASLPETTDGVGEDEQEGSRASRRLPAYASYTGNAAARAPGQPASGLRAPALYSAGMSAQMAAASADAASQGLPGSVPPTPLDTSDLSALRDQLASNPAMLAGMVTTQEVRRDGQVVGYALTFQTSDPAIAQLGLQSGDIVTQVNGIPLTSPAQGVRALNVLASAPEVTATIERGGQVIQVNQSF